MLKVFERFCYKNTCNECSKRLNRFKKQYCICGGTYCEEHIFPVLHFCDNLFKSNKSSKIYLPKIFHINYNDMWQVFYSNVLGFDPMFKYQA